MCSVTIMRKLNCLDFKMSEGGIDLGETIRESDFLYDFPCFQCEKDGENVEAIKYCVDCDENLCTTCLTHHNKFAIMRVHKVLDQVQTSQGQTKQLPSQRCSKHGGKIIDVFCPKHDVVGCSTCISIDHSSCQGKQFIPDVAAGIKTSQELKELESELKTLKSKLDSLKKLKRDNLQRLKQNKDALLKQTKLIRKKMNDQLDKMEEELVNEAETKFKQSIESIHTSITEVDDMLAKLQQTMDQMKSDNHDADIFVTCKLVKREMSDEIYTMHEKVEKLPPERSLELQVDDNTKLIIEGKRMFASIKEKYTIHDVEYKGDNNIRVSDDEQECRVFDMCALPDGCLVMADFNNKKLKKLDPVSCNVSTLIKLPDTPFGLCLVDNTRLAVSLINKQKIQFVSLSGTFTLDNSFSVGDRCRGLAHCDGLLYVSCVGSPVAERKERRGHVEVYTCSGELLRCLYEEFGFPGYISVINDGYDTSIYTGDFYKGVQVRGIDGVIKHTFPTDLNVELPLCVIGTDQICIGEASTGNIYIQTYKDKRILIEKNVVRGNPVCLYFDERSSRLIVTLHKCDVIQVFNLKM